jgi:hypothetical protein
LALVRSFAEIRFALERSLLAGTAFTLAEIRPFAARPFVATRPFAEIEPAAVTTRTVSRLQHLLAAPAAIVELAVAVSRRALGVFVADILVLVVYAAPVMGIMMPVPALHVVPIDVL